jgi:hypothetical protein
LSRAGINPDEKRIDVETLFRSDRDWIVLLACHCCGREQHCGNTKYTSKVHTDELPQRRVFHIAYTDLSVNDVKALRQVIEKVGGVAMIYNPQSSRVTNHYKSVLGL